MYQHIIVAELSKSIWFWNWYW